MHRALVILLTVTLIFSASNCQIARQDKLNSIAESYVKLVLDVGQYDEGYVDFYYGPEQWRPEPLDSSEVSEFPYDKFRTRATELLVELDSWDGSESDELEKARWLFLKKHAIAVAARIDILGGKALSFDEESKALFDAVMPVFEEDDFKAVVAVLDTLVPGSGDLQERLKTYRGKFIVPPEKVKLVMTTALDSARSRTRAHMDLPAGDSCWLEIVNDKPWRAFNMYKKNSTSVIQLNVDSPVRIDMALDHGCHEGYPGHHVHASVWEEKLYREKGWVEFCISPLYAPSSLIAEGIAECAVGVAFPGDETLKFEKEILYPMAGLDPNEAERYNRVQKLVDSLLWVVISVTRNYLDGELSKDDAMSWLTGYGLMTPRAAERILAVAEFYRTYVITYKLGKNLVEGRLRESTLASGDSDWRWQILYELMSTPQVPSGLSGNQ